MTRIRTREEENTPTATRFFSLRLGWFFFTSSLQPATCFASRVLLSSHLVWAVISSIVLRRVRRVHNVVFYSRCAYVYTLYVGTYTYVVCIWLHATYTYRYIRTPRIDLRPSRPPPYAFLQFSRSVATPSSGPVALFSSWPRGAVRSCTG